MTEGIKEHLPLRNFPKITARAENQNRVKVVLEVVQSHQINTGQVLVQQAMVT